MRTNVLLQRPKIGKVIQTTRSLPGDDFAYNPKPHDDHGVREIFQHWATLDRPQTTDREVQARHRPPQDFVATNRAAIRAGCQTAKEFRDFKKAHEILVRPEENFDEADDSYNRRVRQEMIHGIPTPVTTEMQRTLTWQFGRDAVERAKERRLPPLEATKGIRFHGPKWNKAARGETVKQPPPATYADNFKMKRFLAINRYAIDDRWRAE
jgi:nucleoid-associated protein YgaU